MFVFLMLVAVRFDFCLGGLSLLDMFTVYCSVVAFCLCQFSVLYVLHATATRNHVNIHIAL